MTPETATAAALAEEAEAWIWWVDTRRESDGRAHAFNTSVFSSCSMARWTSASRLAAPTDRWCDACTLMSRQRVDDDRRAILARAGAVA
jgi:hypothetical protein